MTVSTTTNKVAYIGNGVAVSFAIPFPFLEKEHLKVWQLLNDIQTERTDWTVSGGNMVFATAPVENAQILIMREVPLTQETDYRENEILPAETLERNFDKLTMQVQQLKEQADRAVTVDVFDDTDAASLIPSIRQAVSDCAGYVATATQKVQEAITQAGYAEASAQAAENSLILMQNGQGFTSECNAHIAHQSFPSDRMIVSIFNSVISEIAQTYVCPSDGWISVYCNSLNRTLLKNTTMNHVAISLGYSAGLAQVVIVPVSKNDVVTVVCDAGYQSSLGSSVFHYANGAI